MFGQRSIEIISTHALTEGDLMIVSFVEYCGHFNSRPHGGRPSGCNLFPVLPIISTHALTEGDVSGRISPFTSIFQLTPSRRATWGGAEVVTTYNFNSRPHGGRQEAGYLLEDIQISTHALTEGDRKAGNK